MQKFSKNLINLTIAYFQNRYGVEITETEAEIFLVSLAKLCAIASEIEGSGRSARPQGGGTLLGLNNVPLNQIP
jgi:hypothetical protein